MRQLLNFISLAIFCYIYYFNIGIHLPSSLHGSTSAKINKAGGTFLTSSFVWYKGLHLVSLASPISESTTLLANLEITKCLNTVKEVK